MSTRFTDAQLAALEPHLGDLIDRTAAEQGCTRKGVIDSELVTTLAAVLAEADQTGVPAPEEILDQIDDDPKLVRKWHTLAVAGLSYPDIVTLTDDYAVPDAVAVIKAGITGTDLAQCLDGSSLSLAQLAYLAREHGMPSHVAPLVANLYDLSLYNILSLRAGGLDWDDIAWLSEHDVNPSAIMELFGRGHGETANERVSHGIRELANAGIPLPALPADVRRLAAYIALETGTPLPDSVLIASAASRHTWTDILTTMIREDDGTHPSGPNIIEHILRARSVDQDPAWENAVATGRQRETPPENLTATDIETLSERGVPAHHMQALADAGALAHANSWRSTWLLEDLYAPPNTPPLGYVLASVACHRAMRPHGNIDADTTATYAAAAAGSSWLPDLLEHLSNTPPQNYPVSYIAKQTLAHRGITLDTSRKITLKKLTLRQIDRGIETI